MSATLPAAPARTPLPRSDFAKPTVAGFARRGLNIAIVGVALGLLIGYLRGDGAFNAIVYSTSIALCSWAFIDFGRFLLNPDPVSGWPHGVRGLVLNVVGCVLGFFAGHLIANGVFGRSTWEQIVYSPRGFALDVAVSAAVGTLITGWYYFRGRTAYHMAQVAASERDATLARLNMLQTQLEPHMLFNTLANLRVLIGIDPPRAQAMLDHMIAYLRATLDGSRAPTHPLAAEFERVADYLALMAVRMGPRLAVALDLPEELKRAPVPPMLLQPLVENCIKHGLEPKVAGGRIDVSARRDGNTLVLSVRDTGNGLHGAPDGSGRSFGLAQVRERLATLFGEAARFELLPAADDEGGTLARITLPLPPEAAR